MKRALQVILLLTLSASLTYAGLSFGSGGGHGQHNAAASAHKRHKSGPSQHVQIKGGIGNGYIYPAKSKNHKSGAGGMTQTYKLIIQNENGHGAGGGSYGPQPQHQGTQVKTFKVITQNAAQPLPKSNSPPIKTLKLIHVNGQNSGCSTNAGGWQ